MSLKLSGKQKSKLKYSQLFYKIKPFLLGTVLGCIVCFIGLFIIAIILMKTETDSKTIYYGMYVFIVLGAFASAVFTQKRIGGRGFLTGILSSLPYLLAVIIMSAFLLSFNVSGRILILVPLCIVGGFLGGITAVNTR